jgi:hypothetical protein
MWPSIDEWISKMYTYAYNRVLFSLKKEENSDAAHCNIENILLSERIKSQKENTV